MSPTPAVPRPVNFHDLIDAGDPVERPKPMTPPGGRAVFPRHPRHPLEPTHDVRAATRTAEHCFMPLTIGGRRPHGDDCEEPAAGRACRQGQLQLRRRGRSGRVPRAADRFGSQCIRRASTPRPSAPGRWEIFTHGGASPKNRGGIDAVAFARTVWPGARGNSCDLDGPGRDETGLSTSR